MTVSIIIPNYNGAKYIKQCIDSVYNQMYKNFELIIVDNASKDESNKIIEQNYPKIKLIKNKDNKGFSIAVNQGIKVAKGDYIVLLNNDTVAELDWLEHLVKCIERDEKIFSVCSKMIRYNEKDKIDDAGDEYTILGWAWKRGDGQAVTEHIRTKNVFSSCAGAAIYRKEVFEQIGYFDENFFAYMEDVDISYRAKIFGYKNVYCAGAKIYHIGSATTGSKYNSFKVKLASRNNVYVAYKNMPLIQLMINLPFLLMGFIIKYLFFIKKGFGKEYKQGIIEAFNNMKNIKRVKFNFKNSIYYLNIELQLIVNLIKYIGYKINFRVCK